MPTVLVLLDEQGPVGMVALCLDGLDGRPKINPWLAGLYVDPTHHGNGFGRRLIRELEAFASTNKTKRLSLYTSDAAGLYASVGWNTIKTFDRKGTTYSIMQKHIG